MLNTGRPPIEEASEKSPKSGPPCQILAKKGFLTARNLTSGVALLVYSRDFQLGVLLHLAGFDEGPRIDDQTFTKSAMAMILNEFQTLGVRRRDLLTYAVGGSAQGGKAEASPVVLRRLLWRYGLALSASDLGGRQSRSVWMDVETGRIIIRSEHLIDNTASSSAEICVAS
jgi:chemotaxis receptor (MCP) glutamine deamidase CheD